MFAQFVARKFISPKSNAYASGIDGQGGGQYRISSGVVTNLANTKWLMGCKLWFESVYESTVLKDSRVAQAIYDAVGKPLGFPNDWFMMTEDELDAFENRCTAEQRDQFQKARAIFFGPHKLYVRVEEHRRPIMGGGWQMN